MWRSAEEQAWHDAPPVGCEFGSPDFERLTTLDRYSFGEITSGEGMRQIGIDNIEVLHAQMPDAEIPIPTPGVPHVLKGLFADQVKRTVGNDDMNTAVVSAVGADFNLKDLINEGRV